MSPTTANLHQRIVGSILWAAYGDALGFASEMVDRSGLLQRTGLDLIKDTRPWSYRAGGRYGVIVKLPAGTYSDDTQLRLSTSRALGTGAKFDVEAFSKVELPVFLCYGLGAGKGTKASAANLTKDNVSWFANFHNSGNSSYLEGGGNGAAMRIQPHVWASARRPMHRDISLNVVRNAVCTHGHPRALVGALFHAYQLLRVFLASEIPGPDTWLEDLDRLELFPQDMAEDEYLGRMWLPEWERRNAAGFSQSINSIINECRDHAVQFREVISVSLSPKDAYAEFLRRMDGLDPKSRGSGTKTAVLASALCWLYRDEAPEVALQTSANSLGSDTDTIATLAGAILGAVYPEPPIGELLDRPALLFEAERMHNIANGQQVEAFPYPSLLDWKPPKTGLDAFGRFENGFAVAGLGPVECRGEEEAANKDTVWRWVTTRANQTLLVKSRPVVEQLEQGQIAPTYWSTKQPDLAVSPPAPARVRSSTAVYSRDEARKKTRLESSTDTLKMSSAMRTEAEKPPQRRATLDELLLRVEKAGFAAEVIGQIVLGLADGPEGIERTSAFAAALARQRRFQQL